MFTKSLWFPTVLSKRTPFIESPLFELTDTCKPGKFCSNLKRVKVERDVYERRRLAIVIIVSYEGFPPEIGHVIVAEW